MWGHNRNFPLWHLGSDVSSLPWVFCKAHNLVDCADLAVLTRMKHTHGLATVDFDVSVRLICHYDVKTPDCAVASSTVTSPSYVAQCKY